MNDCDLNDLRSVIVTNLAESLENFDNWIHNTSTSRMSDLSGKFQIVYDLNDYDASPWKLYFETIFIANNNEISTLSDAKTTIVINNNIKNLVATIRNKPQYSSAEMFNDYKCVMLKNSLFNENNISKFSELKWKYDTYHAEKELEKEALRRQNREQSEPKKSWWNKILNYRIA